MVRVGTRAARLAVFAATTIRVGANQSSQADRSRTEAKVSPGAVKVRIIRPARPVPGCSSVRCAMRILRDQCFAQSKRTPGPVQRQGFDPAPAADYQ